MPPIGKMPAMLASRWIWSSVVLAAGCASHGIERDPPLHDRRPNILVILTDDQGYGDAAFHGAKEVATPHLDALAGAGARFTSWYAAAPVCSPSRAAILTGRYPHRAGVPDIVSSQPGTRGLAAQEITLAELLASRGYRTGLAGKWHLGSSPECRPNAQGFQSFMGFLSGCVDYYSHVFYWGGNDVVHMHDLWRDEEEIWRDGEYLTELITEEAVSFIRRHREDPFFLYVAYNAPHYPMHAPREYLDRFQGLPRERQVHAAMIAAVDDGVAAIVAALESEGLAQDTLIFFQSDNGASAEARVNVRFAGSDPTRAGSNHPLRGHKFSLFEGGIRVPAFVCWPGMIPAGQVVDEPAIGMDVFATAARAAGIAPSEEIDGHDLLPLLMQRAPTQRGPLFWAYGKKRAVRAGKWKLILDADDVFLADLENDLGETENLAERHPVVVRSLRLLVTAWETDAPAVQD